MRNDIAKDDIVEEASEDSFPASDPPSFTPVTGSMPKPLKKPKRPDAARGKETPRDEVTGGKSDSSGEGSRE